ncbi:site-2 protease family protein [Arthrobacter sp. R4-81]
MTESTTGSRNGRRNGFGEGIALGRIAGIRVVLAYSWFVIAAFTVFVYGPVLAQDFPRLGMTAYFVALAYALLLLFSVLVHELAHALTAKIYGWSTDKIVLNLWGGHTSFEEFTPTPGRSLIVALAGPAANFVLAAGGWAVISAGSLTGVADILINIFTWANFVIAIFNILPGLPLDGGRLVESAVWVATGNQARGTIAAGWSGRLIVVALIALFVGLPMLRGERPDITLMIVTVLVAGFLWVGASAAIQQGRLRSRLHLVAAAALAEPAVGLSEASTVADVLRLSPAGFPAVVLCGSDRRPKQLVDPKSVAAVPTGAEASTPASAVSYNLEDGAYVLESDKGQDLLQYLSKLNGSEYAVIDDHGIVTGVLHKHAVLDAITGRKAQRNGRR